MNYDAYGTQMGGGASSTFGFTGQQNDAESGLVYLRARMYDPAVGSFLQRDPASSLTGQNYVYAADNPLVDTDPFGLLVTSLCAGGSVADLFGVTGQICINDVNGSLVTSETVGVGVGAGADVTLQGQVSPYSNSVDQGFGYDVGVNSGPLGV